MSGVFVCVFYLTTKGKQERPTGLDYCSVLSTSSLAMQATCCGGTQDPRTWEYPRWPTWEPGETSEDYDRVMATTIKEKPVPEDPNQLPLKMEVHDDDRRGYGILVTWPRSVPFTDGKGHLTLWFSASHYGSKEAAQKAG